MNKVCRTTAISLIAMAVLMFLIGGFTEFGVLSSSLGDPVTNLPVAYNEMLFVQLGTAMLLPASGVFSVPLSIFLLAILAVFFLRKNKTRSLGVLFTVILFLYLFLSFMLMTASYGWFSALSGTATSPATGFWLLLFATLFALFAVQVFVVEYIITVYNKNHASETQIAEVRKWKSLLDDKVIDENEFVLKKTEILNGKRISFRTMKQQQNLIDLKDLFDSGAITAEEYEAKKKEILG